MGNKKLPKPCYIAKKLEEVFSRGYPVEKRSKILGRRYVWGLYDEDNERLLIRRGLTPDQQRQTLLHEGIHALYPPERYRYATEEAIEESALQIDASLNKKTRKRFASFIPND